MVSGAGKYGNQTEGAEYFHVFFRIHEMLGLSEVFETAHGKRYKAEQEKLAGHPFSNFFMTKRNRVVHEGETDINSGMMTLGKGGEIKFLHYFSGEPFLRDIDGSPLDVVTSSDVYLNLLTSIVKHCEERFRAEVDVTDMFTEQALMKHGLTVEDLEEMLGFPSGWTVGFPVEERLRILKKEFSR